MLRHLGVAVTAVSSLLVGALIVGVMREIPVATWLVLSKSVAPDCEPPMQTDVPTNVGILMAVDVRESDSKSAVASAGVSDWTAASAPLITTLTSSRRELVVYVHGFNTGPAEANCVGENLLLDLARLHQYRQQEGPDVLVFLWPGELGLSDFSQAQRNASLSAQYLSSLIGKVAGRKLYLVAHSLGSKVLMEALSGLPEPIAQKAVSGVLLVAGAIPATSVRIWSETTTTRFPAAEPWNRSSEPRPIQEHSEGAGEYVAAASRAEHIVVTIASGDSVLGQMYAMDQLFVAGTSTTPQVPPWPGTNPRTLPQHLAIGSPFPNSPIFWRDDHELKDPADRYGRPASENPVARLQLRDPSRVRTPTESRYDFRVLHPSYHELALADIRWRPLTYWHAPLNDQTMRREILARAWALFAAPRDNRSPTNPRP